MTPESTAFDGVVTVNGLDIHYVDWGNSSAPPLVLLHGLRSFAHNWDLVASELRDHYHVLALDQRGRGESDWDPGANYYTRNYVSDLTEFIEQLGLSQVTLIGHSMGGANVIVYAANHPENVTAVVVEDMGPRTSSPTLGGQRIAAELDQTPAEFASWALAESFLRSERPSISEGALALRLANTMRELGDGRVVWKFDLQGIIRARQNATESTNVDLWRYVRELQSPTLVLRGMESDTLAWATAQEMMAVNERVHAVQVPGATHYVHDDNLTVFLDEVRAFLSTNYPQGPSRVT